MKRALTFAAVILGGYGLLYAFAWAGQHRDSTLYDWLVMGVVFAVTLVVGLLALGGVVERQADRRGRR